MEVLDVANPFPGGRAYLLDRVGSTQEEARRLAERWEAEGGEPAFPPGSLVAAEEQTAGRGRIAGRRWSASPGEGLLFTLRLPVEAAVLPALPLRIGAAVCGATLALAASLGASFPRPPRLKWPNDLMLGDRKACGILCEAGRLGVLAGVGINCNQRAFPDGLGARATSLALELGREIDRRALLGLVLDGIRSSLGEGPWREGVESLLWRRGEEVSFAPGPAPEAGSPGRTVRALLAGIDESGCLVLETDGGRRESFPAGELRGVPGAEAAS